MDLNQICPHCGATIPPGSFFCPLCGQKIREKPISLLGEFGYYLMSLLVPPLGYWYLFKIYKRDDPKAKRVALISAGLTTFSLVLTFWSVKAVLDVFNQAVNSASLYQDYGSLGI
jgi:hypothetical protein